MFPTPWTRVPRGRSSTPSDTWRGHLPLEGRGSGPAMPVDPDEGRHLLVLGETGMGKSTLLTRLAVRAAARGGVILLDPLGDSARRFISLLPMAERERTVLIAPVRSPVGINAIGARPRTPDDPLGWGERARDDVVTALRRIRSARYEDSAYWGPRLDELATMAIDAASRWPPGTLREAESILEGATRRMGPVPPPAATAVAALRARVADRPDEVDGTRRLFAEITRHAHLRQLLCEPRPRWSVDQAANGSRIVVISGEAPLVGENVARSLLAVHLALLWPAVIARAKPSKIFLVLDEVQWYAHESLGEMLRLGRRFNLHVWAATQSLSRLPAELRDALLTNSADIVAFRGSPEEAREFARWSTSVRADEVVGLAVGHALALLDKGRNVEWITTEPPGPGVRRGEVPFAEVAERSSAWVVPPDGPRGMSDPAGDALSPTEDDLRPLILALWAGLLADEAAPEIRVPLDELRRVLDPEGRRVRELGRRLADAGVRLDSGRDDAGRFWTIRRFGFDPLLGGAVGPEELARGQVAWSAVVGHRGAPAARK